MPNGLPRSISCWWEIATLRRLKLIAKKHKGGGLTKKDEAELTLLRRVADAVLDYVAPPGKKAIRSMEEYERRFYGQSAALKVKVRNP